MHRERSAFTLMEVVLVLAIILMVVAISYPSLEGMYATYRVQAAVDAVRARWAEARSQAVEEGRPYRFAVIPNKGNFRIAPDGAEFWSNGGAAPESSDPNNPPLVVEDALPRGVRFMIGDLFLGGSDDLDGDSALPPEEVNPGLFTTMVTFLPDGTASDDVRIVFQAQGTTPKLLILRSLTGAVTVRSYDPAEDQR